MGMRLAKRLRAEKVPTPILMLTAKDSVQDIVMGLDLGADDYLTKPFSFNELLARLRAVKRRALVPEPTSSRWTISCSIRRPERFRAEAPRLALTRTEYSLLERLMGGLARLYPAAF